MLKTTLKLAGILSLALSLSSCLEVEDDSNDEVAANLAAQNKILQDQLAEQQKANNPTPVTLYGIVQDVGSNQGIKAKLTLTFGSVSREPITSDDGNFKLENVPANSDYALKIESPDNKFLTRTYFGRTPDSNGASSITRDLGVMFVSQGKELQISVVNSNSDTSITDLVFRGNYDVGSSSQGVDSFVSNYDADTKLYKIVVPRDINATIRAHIDNNNDGEADYSEVSGGATISNQYLVTPTSGEKLTFGLTPLQAPIEKTYQVRISVLDVGLNASAQVKLKLSNSLNGNLTAGFDSDSGQHVMNLKLRAHQGAVIGFANFSQNGSDYQSGSIQLSLSVVNSVQTLQITFTNSANESSIYALPAEVATIDLAFQARVQNSSSILRRTLVSQEINAPNYEWGSFYSSPIKIHADSIKLIQNNVLQITRGNASDTDLILAGQTRIEVNSVELPLTTSLSLNDTKLSAKPQNALAADGNFRYESSTVIDKSSDKAVALSVASKQFTTPASEAFSIDDIIADNNNFTTNGETILSENTAGTASTNSNNFGSINLVFPTSITGLKNLQINVGTIIRAGQPVLANQSTVLVNDGNVNTVRRYAVSTASNEQILSSAFSLLRGTTLSDGAYYTYQLFSTSTRDHTDNETNQVRFAYSYETQAGEVFTGVKTLDVK